MAYTPVLNTKKTAGKINHVITFICTLAKSNTSIQTPQFTRCTWLHHKAEVVSTGTSFETVVRSLCRVDVTAVRKSKDSELLDIQFWLTPQFDSLTLDCSTVLACWGQLLKPCWLKAQQHEVVVVNIWVKMGVNNK